MGNFEFKEENEMSYFEELGGEINKDEHSEKKTVQHENKLPILIELLPDLLQDMHKKSIPFSIDGITGNILVDGFYKNGAMSLKMDENFKFEAVDKRGRITAIHNLDDLIKLNFDWWRRSAGKSGNFANPTKPWLEEFQQRNLVKRQYVIIPVEDSFDNYDE